MRLPEALYTRAIWPLTDSSFRGMSRHLPGLRARAHASLEDNQAQQWQALTRMLWHAWETSPFYQRRFRTAGLHPEDIRTPADLERLPVLTRDDLRQHLDEICSNRYLPGDLQVAATGGTTDTPVSLRRDRPGVALKRAIQHSFLEWAGAGAGDKVFWLWQAPADFNQHPSWRGRLFDRYVMRQAWAPIARMNAAVMEDYRQRLNRLRPKLVCSYPSPLYLFCKFLRDTGRPFHRPQTAICTAEVLLPGHRALIEEVLQCRIFEQYGSRDFGMIASECEMHRGLHLHSAAAFVEFRPVGEAGAGVRELLVTDLNNFGMPLIRYQINDCVDGPPPPRLCACGRGFPVLPSIVGRATDIFRLPDGSYVPGIALANRLIRVAPKLAKTQVVQETLHDFRFRYVPGPGFAAADFDRLRTQLAEYFPAEVRWEFEAVADIAREASGKTRFCISKLSAAELAN